MQSITAQLGAPGCHVPMVIAPLADVTARALVPRVEVEERVAVRVRQQLAAKHDCKMSIVVIKQGERRYGLVH